MTQDLTQAQMEQVLPDPDPKVIARLISQDPGRGPISRWITKGTLSARAYSNKSA